MSKTPTPRIFTLISRQLVCDGDIDGEAKATIEDMANHACLITNTGTIDQIMETHIREAIAVLAAAIDAAEGRVYGLDSPTLQRLIATYLPT